MGRSAQERIERLLSAAEADKSCLVLSEARDTRLANRLVEKRVLFRPMRGMYARATTWRALRADERHLWRLRALQAKHPDWVFCGVSAAVALGLPVSYRQLDEAWVSSEGRTRRRTAGIRWVSASESPPTVVAGLRVTGPVATLYDCARLLSFSEGLVVVDAALHSGLATRDELIDFALDGPDQRHGMVAAYVTFLHADPRAESGGESLARAAIIEMGYQVPDLQTPVPDALGEGGGYRLDFCWRLPDGGVIAGELDGREKYEGIAEEAGRDGLDALIDERQRESRITARGIRVMRFSYGQMRDRRYLARLFDSYGVPRAPVPTELVSRSAARRLFARDREARRSVMGRPYRMRLKIDGVFVTVHVLCEAA